MTIHDKFYSSMTDNLLDQDPKYGSQKHQLLFLNIMSRLQSECPCQIDHDKVPVLDNKNKSILGHNHTCYNKDDIDRIKDEELIKQETVLEKVLKILKKSKKK